MIKVVVVYREPGSSKLDYSLEFDLPGLPAVGDYISVQRADVDSPLGEDLIVRRLWWRLKHPSPTTGGKLPTVGKMTELFVECDRATGPYSTKAWTDQAMRYRDVLGIEIAEMDVSPRR